MIYWKLLFAILGLVASGYLLICITLYIWQNRLIFVPSTVVQTTPEDLELAYEDVWIPVETVAGKSERIHGWWIPASQPPKGVILYLHGNGENVGANVGHASRFHRMGFSVLLIDYRGYGRSEGRFPREHRVYEDAEMAWDYLTQTRGIQPQDIFLYGHSLGGAIAVELASRHGNVAGIIIESSFTSMRDMVTHLKRYGFLPIDLILHHKFESITKIKSLSMPMLFIHGTEDFVVPSYMSEMLYDAATTPHKQIFIVPNAGHNDVATVSGEDYFQTIEKFYKLTQNHLPLRK